MWNELGDVGGDIGIDGLLSRASIVPIMFAAFNRNREHDEVKSMVVCKIVITLKTKRCSMVLTTTTYTIVGEGKMIALSFEATQMFAPIVPESR